MKKLRMKRAVAHKDKLVRPGEIHEIVLQYECFSQGNGAIISVGGVEIPLKPGEWEEMEEPFTEQEQKKMVGEFVVSSLKGFGVL